MNTIVTIIIGFLTILTSLIAIIQTRRFNAYQKKVVEHQGVFREPSINLKLFDKPANLTFIFSLPLCEKPFIEVPSVISLRNNGGKSAEAVELFIRTHKDLVLGGPSLKKEKFSYKNVSVYQPKEIGPFQTTIFSLNDLHPKQPPIEIRFPMSFRTKTLFPHHVSATSKDNVSYTVKTWLNFSFPFDIVITQKDKEPISYRAKIQVIDTSKISTQVFFSKYNDALNKEQKRILAQKTWYQKIKYYWENRNSSQKVILILIKSEDLVTEKIKNNIGGIEYKKASQISIIEGGVFLNGYYFPTLNNRVDN